MRAPSPPYALPLLLLAGLPAATTSKAILGIDLGSLYMKVALVQRNAPLEVVTNLHSKRKTEQMVLFDDGRLYGADAASLRARKPHLTPAAMSVLLGRGADHPAVRALEEERGAHAAAYNATRSGVCLTVAGREYTPEELVAMVLTHARDITVAYGVTVPVGDCVLTVPAFYTQHERRALLDAAALADLKVLALMNENTAAALHFGIDRIDEAPLTYLFYNMGAGSLQVSVVRYLSYLHKATKYAKEKRVGGFEVLASAWDSTLGGATFDARLVEHMADEFNQIWNKARGTDDKEVRNFPKAMTKLRIQANKVKHVLSANTDIPVFIDALVDDVNYQTHISRATFEELCHDLLERATAPVGTALAQANVTLDGLDAVELIGGAMRVPKVQEALQGVLGEKIDLGMHLNSDESMALGAAFRGANVSTSFKVRHVGMADVNAFPVAVDLTELAPEEATVGGGLFGIGRKKKAAVEGDADADAWAKRATVFKLGARLGVKKTIAFSHDKDVHVALSYEDGPTLPPGTEPAIEQYDVRGIPAFAEEVAEKGLGVPKVSLQFEMDASGLTRLLKAEAAVEEIVTVEEEVEVEVEDEEDEGEKTEENGEAEGEMKEGNETATEEKEGAAKEDKAEEGEAEEDKKEDGEDEKEEGHDKKEEGDDKKEEGDDKKKEDEDKKEEDEKKDGKKDEKKEKKKKTKMVQKEVKKKHTRTLKVASYHTGSIRPYSPEIMAESKAKLALLAKADEERVLLEESKNKFESYIYYIRNRLVDDEDVIAKVTTEDQRAALSKSAEDAEEWMFDDGYAADLDTYEAKYKELSAPAIKVFFRAAELTARPKAMEALTAKLTKIEELMTKWETTMTHITEEERGEVLDKVGEVRTWLEEKVSLQEATDATEDPAFTSEELPGQTKRIESLVARLLKKKKPKPPEKNETETEKNETEAEKNETETEGNEKDSTPEGKESGESSESAASSEESETKENGVGGEEESKSETSDTEEKIQEDEKDDEL